ncbi:Gnk2-homologous domain [Arabidopsis thaliana x Arabidopsis arenosa]|uniref:Gnk2-homologous domain n=1 Tax=Arabidopsis thaliana x Arabidopsis arenosa TaxID=1240361 RepID=A0A8T2AX81_9BRAS|nr:Gnk2-homologous domain [Arabidopsis thaliana x Arabidopsis arenosa]
MSSSKRIVWFPILLVAIQILSIHTVLSQSQNNAFLFHKCSDIEGSFTSKSPYESNLNNLFPQLSYKVPSTGFATSSAGITPDNVNGLALCRGDASSSDCSSCLATAIPEIRQRCPSNKAGIIWYDNCLVKYSSTNFFGKIDFENKFYLYNVNNVSDPSTFNTQTKALLTKLTKKATTGDNEKLFATGEKNIGKKKLYGLVQCTRDLKSVDCKACLNGIIGELPNCCDGKEGGRVVGGSCNFGYEIYPFVKTA